MRHHLNTLYVTSEGAYVRKDGANLVVELDGAERGRAPIHLLGGLVCFGRVVVSAPAMGFCAESNVAVTYLDEQGRFLARVVGKVAGNVLLRRTQYRLADDESASVPIVRGFVAAKVANQRTVLLRALRDHGAEMAEDERALAESAERRLFDIARRTLRDSSVAALRGLEGEAGAAYFGAFNALIRVEGEAFRFRGRSRRPPLDPVNALLSFLYAMLGHDCRSALETVGLDPYVGFLHADRPGRPSLALDLMEEFRPVVADRVALSLINRRQLGEGDFRHMENGAVLLGEEARRTLLVAYQERKKGEITHPYIQETMPLGLVPHMQAQLLARHLRGDIDGYPGFVWR